MTVGAQMSRIIFSIIFLACYAAWVVFRQYGWIPFYVFQAILIIGLVNEYYRYKNISLKIKNKFQDIFPNENYFKFLIKYGHAIYSPLGSESIAVSCTVARFMGFVVFVIFLLMERYLEAVICLANTFLFALLAGRLDPIFFMSHFAKKKPEYGIIVQVINELREFIHLKLPQMI
jgi:hypothetical protein